MPTGYVHRMNGIMITRWNLSLSLTLALTVVMGGFSLLWERTNALHATQLELVTRVTRLEVQVTALQEDVTVIREDVTALREELHESVADLREEFRAEIAGLREELREEIRELGDLIRARETLEVGAQ